MSAPPAKRTRKSIQNSQRKALRVWYNDDFNGKHSLESASQLTVVVDNLRLQVEYIHRQRDSFPEMGSFERQINSHLARFS